jgi:hypothetical protein
MTDSTDLERRYRRLLALYPKVFRQENGQEILSVLMAGAAEGQRWPRLAESGDLLKSATVVRLRHPQAWEQRHHPGLWIWVRVLSGFWLLILTGILCQYGDWWGLALLAPAALHFYLAHRLGRFVEGQRPAGGPPSPPPPVGGG